ncbi:MAG: ABC transporter permease [Desulfobacteraceae bacterium]|jgi:peptide/nickel transport system permease protein
MPAEKKPISRPAADETYMPPSRSPWAETWHLLRKNRMALTGLVIFLIFFAVALGGLAATSGKDPILDPARVRLQEKLRPPMSPPKTDTLRPDEFPALGVYLLGTDDLGRDVFARMLQGAWVSLTVGFVAVGIAVGIGILLGGIAGYYGRRYIQLSHFLFWLLLVCAAVLVFTAAKAAVALTIMAAVGLIFKKRYFNRMATPPAYLKWMAWPTMQVDTLIMRAVDIMLCFPSFFLILTVVALLPPSIYNIMIIIGLTSWMGTTRFVRAEFLSLREQDFVAAARALGISDARIIFRHIMPNAVAPVLVSATLGIASAMLTEAGLSFLGFGVPPPHATWGNILSDGKAFIFDAPWLTFAPGLVILVVVLAFNLFGEGMRDILNPKLRERN